MPKNLKPVVNELVQAASLSLALGFSHSPTTVIECCGAVTGTIPSPTAPAISGKTLRMEASSQTLDNLTYATPLPTSKPVLTQVPIESELAAMLKMAWAISELNVRVNVLERELHAIKKEKRRK